jgi:hypothetical protein
MYRSKFIKSVNYPVITHGIKLHAQFIAILLFTILLPIIRSYIYILVYILLVYVVLSLEISRALSQGSYRYRASKGV